MLPDCASLTLQEPPWLDAQLNVYNVDRMLSRSPAHYDFLRFDPNNTCNVQCVYCHGRSILLDWIL
jgi:hypothetical protein